MNPANPPEWHGHSDEDLIASAGRWREDADALLAESGLLDIAAKYGKPELVGSYRYGLMQNGDIDLYVMTEDPSKDGPVQFMNDVIQQCWWNGYLFYDWVHFGKPEFPTGYYVGLKNTFRESRWKVDVWFLTAYPYADHARYLERMETGLTREQRVAILRLKREKTLRRWPLTGTQIYTAVLDFGITLPEQAEKHFALPFGAPVAVDNLRRHMGKA